MNQLIRTPSTINPKSTYIPMEKSYNQINQVVNQYKTSEEFINNFDFDIVMIDVNNNHIILKSIKSDFRTKKELTIRKNYQWSHDNVIFNVDGISCVGNNNEWIAEDYPDDSELFNDVFINMIATATNRRTGIRTMPTFGTVNMSINEQVFNKFNQCLYIKELGVVITTREFKDNVVHPLSPEARLVSEPTADNNGFVFQLFANDPTGVEYSTRYINLNNSVYRVNVQSDSTLPAGVYVSQGVAPIGEEHTSADLKLRRYDFSEADKELNLYTNISDAKDHYGRESSERVADLKQREHDFLIFQQNAKKESVEQQLEFTNKRNELEIEYRNKLNTLKEENDKLKAQAEVRAAELKKVADDLDNRSMRRKDEYESASYSRKGWGEIIKWIPGVLAGALTCVGIAFALFL